MTTTKQNIIKQDQPQSDCIPVDRLVMRRFKF